MRHAGKAFRAARRILLWGTLGLLAPAGVVFVAFPAGGWALWVSATLGALWLIFILFTFWFFRDPTAKVPEGDDLLVAPAHGKVDVIDEITEPEWIQGQCRRISIFLSIFDVHVQNAPAAGVVEYSRHTEGQFLNAMNLESAAKNENVLFGMTTRDGGQRIGVRLIAGLIARRIVPWAQKGDTVERGERLALIQFGSRVELYLPLTAQVRVRVGDRVKGGETIVARRPD